MTGTSWLSRALPWRAVRHGALLLLICVGGGAVAQEQDPGQIRALLADQAAQAPARREDAAVLARFYAERGYRLAWRASADVQAALALLDGAADHGLEPADYAAARDAVARLGGGDASAATGADVMLSRAVLRYLVDLHAGRTRGTVLSSDARPEQRFDAAALLQEALAGHGLAGLEARAVPHFGLYGRLQDALRRYRAMAAQGDTAVPASVAPRTAGADARDSAALRRRLVELGDLADGPGDDGQLVAALRRFQQRHGLGADGIAGRATLAALNVPLRERVRQLAFALERLRWLPALPERRVVVINLPSYRLWAVDRHAGEARPVLDMPVIVGKALRTPTPVFIGTMRQVEFNPYWNVPPSILRNELLAHVARDPDYLRRNNMEVVLAGAATQDVDAAILGRLRSGAARVRQRPGPDNALGAVKFVLPNSMNIYLHGTPARALFERARRDFSHGCIRVQDPAALAGFVLVEQGWDAAAVAQAMAPGTTRVVRLQAPLPVVIFYTTAIAEADGTVTFLADVYGLDAALARRWDAP
ncbi:L,D-transpeptidase family protein [[Empedobacter] haloabium]|uniref:L,D-transpeptidase family protein n=1 Tax=[Empedobacter] haloabium TaxID=592317 RepID=A0ABZ1UR07_9BURK